MNICRIDDVAELRDFHSGVPEMDNFIHNELTYSVDGHFCVPYALKDGDKIVAFYALSYDSLILPEDYFDDLMQGYSSSGKPMMSARYLPTFKNKQHYPAMDIAYFAVAIEYQHQSLGSLLLEDIVNRLRMQDDAGCQFVVVDALVTNRYSAIGFYAQNGFTVCEDKLPCKDCVRMYRVLYPRPNED